MASTTVKADNPLLQFMGRLQKQGPNLMAGAVFGLLVIVLVPLPTVVLDLLLAFSFALSLLIVLVTLSAKRALDLSVFPSLLLATTVFRLSLNIASTRLILLGGAEGTAAAGDIIEAFGAFVVGGNYMVGFVVFAILVIINFVVITKGAGRVAEVGARFTLDAMPGKQMAIDAELNAGLIDETVARTRREEVQREADFFGSMDGASKFIRGDAIAGIVIMIVNIVGGVFIGTIQNGMGLAVALQNYTLLTIGDGLVGQVPALIVSAAAGMLVTRVPEAGGSSLDSQLGKQLLGDRRTLIALAVVLGIFAMVPGLTLPFLLLAAMVGLVAWQYDALPELAAVGPATERAERHDRSDVAEGEDRPAKKKPHQRPEELLAVEPLAIEVGVDLIYLVDERKGGELLERVQRTRNQFAKDLGVVLPSVHLRDNLDLGNGGYRILLRGEELARGELHARKHLAIDSGTTSGVIRGVKAIEPVFGLPAVWIGDKKLLQAQRLGYTCVDVSTVLTTHLVELMHIHCHELFDMVQLTDALNRISERNPRLVDDLVPEPLPRTALLRVFRNLIREGVSVRDVDSILEALADYAPRTQDPDTLTEFVRQRLLRQISGRFSDSKGVIHYIALDPGLEELVTRSLKADGGSMSLSLPPDVARQLLEQVRDLSESYSGESPAVLLAPPLARGPVRRLLERVLPRVPVVSPSELLPTVGLDRVGTVRWSSGGRR